MTTLATVLTGPQAIVAATAPPTMGTINSYNAAAGTFSNTLQALSTLNVGASCIVEKSIVDTTLNAVTFVANGADVFDDGSTGFNIQVPGQKRVLQVISVNGVRQWKVTNSSEPPTGILATTSEFSLTNSTTLTTVTTYTIPTPGQLFAGSTYRITLNGSVQVTSTSGTLTFTPNIQGTALAQTAQMASQTSAAGPVGFVLEYVFTVRTTGASGSAIAKPFGIINFATPVYLFSTSTTATTINTTAAASSNVLSVQAQWATANASNTLLVETATIERII